MSENVPPGDDSPAPPSAPPPVPPPIVGSPTLQGNSGFLVLSYLWILAVIPFVTVRNDPNVQWHAKHGLVLLAAEIALWAGIMFSGFVIHPFLMLLPVLWLGIFVFHVLAIIKALNGQRLLIPGLSELADKF